MKRYVPCLLTGITVLLLGIAGSLRAEDEVLARHRAIVISAEGGASYRPAASRDFRLLKKGRELGIGDVVRTGDSGKVRLRIGNLGIFDVLPKTEVRILDLTRTRAKGRYSSQETENLHLDLKGGAIRGLLEKPAAGTGNYRIATPIGVVGVRGTTFKITAAPMTSSLPLMIGLLEGSLEVVMTTSSRDSVVMTEDRSLVVLDNKFLVDALGVTAKIELTQFRDESREELKKKWSDDRAMESKEKAKEQTEEELRGEIEQFLRAVADAYERESVGNFMESFSQDFKGTSQGQQTGNIDYYILRDDILSDFNQFDRIQIFFVIKRFVWFKELDEVDVDVHVRFRAVQAVGGLDVLQGSYTTDNETFRLRLRREEFAGKKVWRIVSQT